MNFKNIFGAFAIAAAGIFATATTSIAAVDDITDRNGDDTSAFALSVVGQGDTDPVLTLAKTGPLTAGFDNVGERFIFEGFGASNGEQWVIASSVPFAITRGTLTDPIDFSRADVTISSAAGSQTVDLLTQAGLFISTAVSSPFTITTNFEVNAAAGSKGGQFDFRISAVPLPAGLALLLGGLGLLGWVGRRRQTVAA